MHWISECLHKSGKRLQSANVIEENDRVLNKSDEETVEDVKMVLLTYDVMDCAIFIAETERPAVVDTARSKTVVSIWRLLRKISHYPTVIKQVIS